MFVNAVLHRVFDFTQTIFVRLSPECPFVLEKKGKQFIEDYQVKLKPSVFIPTQKITHIRTIE